MTQPATRLGRFIRRLRVRQLLRWRRKAMRDKAVAEGRIKIINQILREIG